MTTGIPVMRPGRPPTAQLPKQPPTRSQTGASWMTCPRTVHMLTGVIDPAGSAAATPSQGMVMLRSISPIRYAIEALCQSELQGAVLAPSASEAGKLGGVALLRSGDVFLERLGVSHAYQEAITCLLALLFFHLLLAAILLVAMKPRFQRARPSKHGVPVAQSV
ncbi:unnamed protein product [Durusdinium trenchii]